ncbi:methyl-accepting chemotaxis protein [Paenalkalicoccus suaedae]|uniref:Methyl-accepting chemotaxis protein n=1 Tax=Paenalkalicoccus suaedae TaxID=2592382 RepID=A0A859FJL6_9BACI|nr:methyl-accepting chemotaxis protein [Paenalkalicoccus suaedae]QKS73001.1 methyl-accepting chemotaxis protein [Paenalkalicoccus suaedae]
MNALTSIFKKSIHSQLIFYFLLVGIVPMIITSVLVYQSSSEAIVDKEQELMETQTVNTVYSMEQWLEKRLDEVKIVASSEAIQSGTLESQLQLMNVVQSQDDTYETVVFTALDGIVAAHTNEAQIGVLDLSDRDYFQNGLNGEDTISSVLTSNATGNRIVVVATPVESATGTIIGVMSASVNFEQLVEQYLQPDETSQTDSALIFIDDQDIIQAHPDPELIGVSLTEANVNGELLTIFEQGKIETGTEQVEINGEDTLMSYAPIERAGYGIYMITPLASILTVVNAIRLETIVIMAISAVVITLLAIFIARNMSRPIRTITEQVKRIAASDLTGDDLRINKQDEIGVLARNINVMSHSLKEMVDHVSDSAERVAASSEELSASSDEVSRSTEQVTYSIQHVASGAETQSNGINDSSRAIDDVNERIQAIVTSATSVSGAAENTIHKAKEGGESVRNNVVKMNKINDSVTSSVVITKTLVDRSNEISSILEVITSIAEQTNLLALNAAIEAARAGEHGKGFAVVADEVRKLAESSQQSSGQISEIIAEIQREMNQTNQAMNGVMTEVKEGLVIANETENHFQEIISSTNEVASQITSMASTTMQISDEVERVSSAFADISAVTESTTANAEEVAAASEEQLAAMEEVTSSAQYLSQLATELKDVISKFKV